MIPPMDASMLLPAAAALAFAVFLAQVFDANAEYNASSFIVGWRGSEWWLHNDEKTILPEARALWLRRSNGSRTDDVGPWPISAAFGVASTALNLAGFCLFGFSPAGFRSFYLFASFLANIFFIGSLFILFAPTTAFLLSLFVTLNYRVFLAGRHAYPENFLSLVLSASLYVFLLSPEFFIRHIFIFSFLAASVVLFKQNFSVYTGGFITIMALFFGPSIHSAMWCAVAFVAGTAVFELLQCAIFAAAGTLALRWRNMACVGTIHLGKKSSYATLKNFPDGAMTFFRYASFFMDWLEIPHVLRPFFRLAAICLVAGNICLLFLGNGANALNGMLISAHVIFLGVSSLMFFYLKRAYSWFPLTIIAMALVCAEVLPLLGLRGELLANLSLCALLAVFLFRQAFRLRRLGRIRVSRAIKDVAELEALVPDGAIVYAHCFPWRYFWHSKKIRFKACDDQVMDNEKIIDWALREKGEFLLLASRDTGVDALAFKDVKCRRLKTFHPSPVATDYPESYLLCQITRD